MRQGKRLVLTPEECREQAKSLDGSLNVAVGGPKCGKTHWASRFSVSTGFYGGDGGKPIPWFAYDSNGDVFKHLVGMKNGEIKEIRALEKKRSFFRSDPEIDRKLEERERRLKYINRVCFKNLYRGPDKLQELLDRFESWVMEGVENADESNILYSPRAVLFIDEAGAVRAKSEKFWPRIREARNAGVTVWSTGHRLVDWNPAALACIRCVLLWRHPAFDRYDIGGMTILREKCGIPRHKLVRFIVGMDPSIYEWDSTSGGYPAQLITPAYPSQSAPIPF